MWIDHADDRQNQQPLPNLQHGRRQLPNGLLLLADNALAFLHETYAHGVGDAIRRGLVSVQDAVQHTEVALILFEQGSRQHIAQQEHDAQDFVRFDAARNNPLGKIARVFLKRLHTSGLEHRHVIVVDSRGFDEDFFLSHGGQQPRFGDSPRPFFPELRSVLPEVRHQLCQQSLRSGFIGGQDRRHFG